MKIYFRQILKREYDKAIKQLTLLQSHVPGMPNKLAYIQEMPKALKRFQDAISLYLNAYLKNHQSEHKEVFMLLQDYNAKFFKQFGISRRVPVFMIPALAP